MRENSLSELRAADRHWLGRACLYPPGLVVAVLALVLATSTSVTAENGEHAGAQGLHGAGICDADFKTYCDMRFDGDVVSCHFRGIHGDEGFAIGDCTSGGRVTSGAAENEFLERNVTVKAWDAGQIYCGTEPGGVEFCVVCDTVKSAGSGRRNVIAPGVASCVKFVNDGQPADTGTCGAYSIAPDPGGDCSAETESLRRSFSDPVFGFFITADLVAAGEPGGKHITACLGVSWHCLDTQLPPIANDVQLQQQQRQGLTNTPGCIPLAGGRSKCIP